MRLRAALALGVTAVLAGGCGILQVESPLVPGSQWRVAAIDGEPTEDTELILTFIGDAATLSSECGAGTSEVAMAEDTHAITFGPFSGFGGGSRCPEDAQALHQRIADELEGLHHWVQAGRSVELQAERVIELAPQRTDT